MSSLAETQSVIRRAIVAHDSTGVAPLLAGGRRGETRLEIHRRHYEASLATALLGRFPATAWLVGASFITEAARHFVREKPPVSPCLAEYGEAFPQSLSMRPGADRIPYLLAFAELDWILGNVSVAIDHPALTAATLARVDPDALPEARLTMQPGVCYLRADWPIDELITLYLTDSAPDVLSFDPGVVGLEIRGARGEFRFNHLELGQFVFRQQLLSGLPLGAAAERALAMDDRFEPAEALADVFADGLVVEVTR